MAQAFKIKPSIPLKLGWISYFNLLPLRHELERLFGSEVEWHKGHPSSVNRWLADGKVALAPCSSVCLLKNSQNEIAFPLGIASYGPVMSVYIGLHHEDVQLAELIRTRQAMLRELVKQGQQKAHGDARKLAAFLWKASATLPPVDPALVPPLSVTPNSAASTTFARILFRLWFGQQIFEMRAAETNNCAASNQLSLRRPMELLIGDEALAKRPNFRAVIDLGEAWRDLTDLPFVFAVWQTSGKTLSPYWRQRIFEAAELAQARMRIEPCNYTTDLVASDVQGHPIDLASYWKCIQYRLGPQHFKGLALYLSLARCMSPAMVDDAALANLMRFEALGEERAII